MAIRLIVYTPDENIFNSYYYGYGKVVSQETMVMVDGGRTVCTMVDYGDDKFHANYQRDRFQSGLYHAETVVE